MRKKVLDLISQKPKTMLIFSLFLSALTLPGLFLLKENFSYRVWYQSDDPLMMRYENFEKKFGNDAHLVLGVFNNSGLMNKQSLRLIESLTKELWNIKDIMRVDSLTNYECNDYG